MLRLADNKQTFQFKDHEIFVFQLPFSSHCEWVHARVSTEFNKRRQNHFYLCSTESIACCEEQRTINSESALNTELDNAFCHAYGSGNWLNGRRYRYPSYLDPSTEDCLGRAANAVNFFNTKGSSLNCNTSEFNEVEDTQAPLDKIFNNIETKTNQLYHKALARNIPKDIRRIQKGGVKKQKRKVPWILGRKVLSRESKALVKELQSFQEKLAGTDRGWPANMEKVLRTLKTIEPVTQLVGVIQNGFSLAKPLKDTGKDIRLGLFAEIVTSRNLQNADYKTELQRIFDKGESQIEKTAYSLIWASKLLASGVRIIRRKLDPKYMSTCDLNAEQNIKRRDSGFESLHSIMSHLHCSQGGNAWALYALLEVQGAEVYNIARLAKEHAMFFASEVSAHLNSCDWDTIPDTVQVLHLPAVLSWALRLSFEETCMNLGMGTFALEDPGIGKQLDDIADEVIRIGKERWTMADAEVETRLGVLENRAHTAMRVPLSELRRLCRCRINRQPINTGASVDVVERPHVQHTTQKTLQNGHRTALERSIVPASIPPNPGRVAVPALDALDENGRQTLLGLQPSLDLSDTAVGQMAFLHPGPESILSWEVDNAEALHWFNHDIGNCTNSMAGLDDFLRLSSEASQI
ncbi:hypothetical protein LZ30DRAFT_382329 [Colletotrichum cereale]|nr:hypothetical protein LZ30DRAFT_382329 [Colletotrichum cereale]